LLVRFLEFKKNQFELQGEPHIQYFNYKLTRPCSQDHAHKTILTEPHMTLTIEFDQETDGRFIAEVPQLPGVLA